MRKQISLVEGWHVKELKGEQHDVAALAQEARSPDDEWLAAQMPAQVHDILFAAGRIPDPHIGKNAAELVWIAWSDWAYACTFPTPDRASAPAFLHFKGLDTLAAVYLNGQLVGHYDNMFREHIAEVSAFLAPAGGENVLLVIFASPRRFLERLQQPPEHVGRIYKFKYLRKCTSDCKPYMGARPDAMTVGVFDEVVLDLPDGSWFEDVWVRPQIRAGEEAATLRVVTEVAGAGAQLRWRLTGPQGEAVAHGQALPGAFDIPVEQPKLWWPHTHGQPQLYTLELELAQGERVCDRRALRVGIRDIQHLRRDRSNSMVRS